MLAGAHHYQSLVSHLPPGRNSAVGRPFPSFLSPMGILHVTHRIARKTGSGFYVISLVLIGPSFFPVYIYHQVTVICELIISLGCDSELVRGR